MRGQKTEIALLLVQNALLSVELRGDSRHSSCHIQLFPVIIINSTAPKPGSTLCLLPELFTDIQTNGAF